MTTTAERPEDVERLIATFRKRPKPRHFFKVGKVFRVLWSEPAGDNTTDVSGTSCTRIRFGEIVHSKVRRFVVVRKSETYCIALAITTYGGRGVAKPGVAKAEHGIIYTGKSAPCLLPGERPLREEKPMQPIAIRVNTDNPGDKLDQVSRIDYGKTYTIEHNIKVQSYGQVDQHSVGSLVYQFQAVWQGSDLSTSKIAERVLVGSSTGGAESATTDSLSSENKVIPPIQHSPTLVPPNSHPRHLPSIRSYYSSLMKARIANLLARGCTATEVIDILMTHDNEDDGDVESCSMRSTQ